MPCWLLLSTTKNTTFDHFTNEWPVLAGSSLRLDIFHYGSSVNGDAITDAVTERAVHVLMLGNQVNVCRSLHLWLFGFGKFNWLINYTGMNSSKIWTWQQLLMSCHPESNYSRSEPLHKLWNKISILLNVDLETGNRPVIKIQTGNTLGHLTLKNNCQKWSHCLRNVSDSCRLLTRLLLLSTQDIRLSQSELIQWLLLYLVRHTSLALLEKSDLAPSMSARYEKRSWSGVWMRPIRYRRISTSTSITFTLFRLPPFLLACHIAVTNQVHIVKQKY